MKRQEFKFYLGFIIILYLNCECLLAENQINSTPWRYVPKSSLINELYTSRYMNAIPPRIVKELTEPWTFFYDPNPIEQETYLSPDYNDNKWNLIRLPHTWLTYETTKDIHPFIKNASENDDSYWWKGWGYYRKQLDIDNTLEGK